MPVLINLLLKNVESKMEIDGSECLFQAVLSEILSNLCLTI